MMQYTASSVQKKGWEMKLLYEIDAFMSKHAPDWHGKLQRDNFKGMDHERYCILGELFGYQSDYGWTDERHSMQCTRCKAIGMLMYEASKDYGSEARPKDKVETLFNILIFKVMKHVKEMHPTLLEIRKR